ncbi:uncharacterized protein BJ171DRAFT_414210, partial [Polychytrium aggregatum]|uniref:uncharacterized protein n=1 Tax=Polychytrium aggregatum TaxID=110093 RepID=UPI0022FE7267
WRVFSWMVTCCCPGFLLAKAGHMDKPNVQQAWREKVALCVICFLMCCALAFLIFGFTSVVC